MSREFTPEYAQALDESDVLSVFRQQFYIPLLNGDEAIYFLGNSLGLQPRRTQDSVLAVMENWANFGVEGFFMGKEPWLDFPAKVKPLLCAILGAKESEIVIMNHLTVNLHLLMISFYHPTAQRFKIICEAKAFPSDQYALESQVKLHGFDPQESIIKVYPKEGSEIIDESDISTAIEANKDSVSLVLFSGINYYTGQSFDMKSICRAAHDAGAMAGFDLAHAAGNIKLDLHNWDADFACWCTYKYLNSGPGAIGGAFVHERFHHNDDLPRLEGWWGNKSENRFKMEEHFTSSHTADSWQLSTSPMMPLAAHFSALEIFAEAGFEKLLEKAKRMNVYLFQLLDVINKNEEYFSIITPRDPERRGCQVSLSVHKDAKKVFDQLLPAGIFADWREPNVIRIAPVPLYNSFSEIYTFAHTLEKLLKNI